MFKTSPAPRPTRARRRRRVAIVGAAAVVGAATFAAFAVAGTLTRWGHAPSKPEPCVGPSPQDGVAKEGTPEYRDFLCGSRGNDRFRAVGGHDSVWGYHGDDVIDARNGVADDVWGGPGRDSGKFDPCDNVRGVERRSIGGTCAGTSRLSGSADDTWDYLDGVVECWLAEDGSRKISFLFEPQMLGLDVTRKIDYQTVAWQGVVFRLEGDAWTYYGEGNWYWDHVPDSSVDAFGGNYWRSFKTRRRAFVDWTIPDAGTYAVAVYYRWYKSSVAPDREEAHVVRAHYGPAETVDHEACEFA